MSLPNLVDLVKVQISSTGTGALTLGSAVPGYRGIGVLTNGQDYSYSIQQGGNYEIGTGTYLSSGHQFIRSPSASSNGGATIDLATGAVLVFTALVKDFAVQGPPGPDTSVYLAQMAADVAAVAVDRSVCDTAAGLATTASNLLTAVEALQTGLYANTAAGIAGTTSGKYFAVADNVNSVVKLYLNSSGTAVFQFDLPSNASILALVAGFSTSSDTSGFVALGDSTGFPLYKVDNEGRFLAPDGSAPFETLAAGLAATAPVAISLAVTPSAKLAVDKQLNANVLPQKFEVLLWAGLDPGRGSNAVRMPGLVWNGLTSHIFAHERSGGPGAEEGFGLAWRTATWSMVNQSVTLGAISTFERGSAWNSGIGQVIAPMPFLISQGAYAGTIETVYTAVNPDNLPYSTSGSRFDLYHRLSTDNYATRTKLFDGFTIYTTLGLGTPPDAHSIGTPGFNMAAGNAMIEVPPGYPNAGRRIIPVYILLASAAIVVGTIYAEKDSFTWNLGQFFDFSGLGVSSWNEISMVMDAAGMFHMYVRNDDALGSPTFALTHRGRLYANSTTGISGWTNKQFLTAPNIGNTPNQALFIPDGANRFLIGGSTQAKAGARRQYKMFLGYDPTNFIASCQPFYDTDTAGYGAFNWVMGDDGQPWLTGILEHGNGKLGFNFDSNIYGFGANLPWVMQNMEPL